MAHSDLIGRNGLGIIDFSLKPIKPKLELFRPDGVKIGNLTEAQSNTVLRLNLFDLSELSFSIPLKIDRNNKLIDNPNVQKIKDHYHVRVSLGSNKMWFVINQINIKDDSYEMSCHAFLLPYELSNRKLRGYKADAYNAKELFEEILSETRWKVGFIDPYFDDVYRSFDFSTSILDALGQAATSYNGLLTWDTENRKVNLLKPESIQKDSGLVFSYKKYLDSLDKETQSDELVTRLYCFGKDGMSINGVNPTGQSYIDDFSYFIYPFERDENRNVISHSDWLSDSLCHALLDYQELVQSKENEFSNLLAQKKDLQISKDEKDNQLSALKTELIQIQDRIDLQKANKSMTIHKFTYDAVPLVKQPNDPLIESNKYAVVIKVSNTSNLTIKMDGNVKTVSDNVWTVLGKIEKKTSTSIEFTGSATGSDIILYIFEITSDEFSTANNDSALIEKYIEENKQDQINAKQSEIDAIQANIDNVDNQIQSLRDLLSTERNFTQAQLDELQQFIFEGEINDTNYIDENELYQDAKKKIVEMRMPKTSLKMSVKNFLESIECQYDWDKMIYGLGNLVSVKHEILNLNYQAQMTEVQYDYRSGEINITIANFINKNEHSAEAQLVKMLYNFQTTTVTVDMNKGKWDKIDSHEDTLNSILNEPWKTVEREIIAGTNESVVINNRGIKLMDTNDPQRFIIQNHALIALTKDGGTTWEEAITVDGIVAKKLIGSIIAGENLSIIHDKGSFTVNKDGVIIDNTALKLINPHQFESYNSLQIVKQDIVDFDPANNTIGDIPATPTIPNDGTAIDHTLNPDGTANISFQWDYDGSDDKYNVDGFIIYVFVSDSANPYDFGTNESFEHRYVVPYDKRAFIFYNVPGDKYYSFGIQAYRKVNQITNPKEILYSNIAVPLLPNEYPYYPSKGTAFTGDIRATIRGSYGSSFVILGASYNNVVIDNNSGLVATRSDKKVRTVLNATDGFKIQVKANNIWEDRIYADTEGTLYARKLILENPNGDIVLDGSTGTLNLNNLTVTGTLKADNIEAKSITANHIKDNSITQDVLHVLAKDIINNFTKTADISTGWSILEGTGTVTANISAIKNNTQEVILETNSDATYASDFTLIDPSKSYKVTISLYSDDDIGTRYFGMYAYDANKSIIGVYEWDIASQSWSSSTTTTPYFWSGDGKTVDDDNNITYRDMEAYILSSNIKDNGVPKGRNVNKHFKLPPEARYIRVFVSNKNNNGTTTQVNIWSPTMSVSDTGIFSCSQMIGGTVDLGGDSGGQLILRNTDNEPFVYMDKNGAYIANLRVDSFQSDSVMTINNKDIVYYVDPLNGNDENDGLTTLTPFKSIQKAVVTTDPVNNATITIQLLGSGYNFTEHVVINGLNGAGTYKIVFPSDQSVTMFGTIKIVNSNILLEIDNAIVSWVQNPDPNFALIAPLYIENSRKVFLNSCKFFANNKTQYGIYLAWQSFAKIYYCEVSGGLQSSIVLEDSSAYILDSKGSSIEGVRVKGASLLSGKGTAPQGNSQNNNIVLVDGGVCNATFTPTNGSSTPPSPPTTQTMQWSKVDSASWRTTYGGWRDTDDVYQGQFSSKYGHHRGYWFFPQEMLDTIQGKTISRIRFYCKRKGTGGPEGAVNVGFYYHTYANEATARSVSPPSINGAAQIIPFKIGEQKWFDLPSSWFSAFSNGTAKGVCIYTSSTSSNDYAIFEPTATIEITFS